MITNKHKRSIRAHHALISLSKIHGRIHKYKELDNLKPKVDNFFDLVEMDVSDGIYKAEKQQLEKDLLKLKAKIRNKINKKNKV